MIVAGFGFRAAATEASLRAALEGTGVARVDAVAAPEDKAGAAALRALAEGLGAPVRAVTVAGRETPTRSARVQALRGTGSVAEAAALAAAGRGARLIVGRVVSADRMATCAIAEGETP